MWTRRDLKERAKGLFRANYWKAVLVALVLTFVVGGTSSSGSGFGALPALSSGMSSAGTAGSVYSQLEDQGFDAEDFLESGGDLSTIPGLKEAMESQDGMPVVAVLAMTGMILVIALIIIAIAIVVDVFLLNPLEVGIRRFFSVNLFERAQVRELAYGFDHSYKNITYVMFFRDLHTFLWSLLFIIPGIVKSYEYRMIPYLLAEYPEMTKEDAFAISRYMMSGNKWKTFVLDLSFILWFIGNAVTFGLLGLFYGNPYYAQTHAILYDVLKAEKQPFARRTEAEAAPVITGTQE